MFSEKPRAVASRAVRGIVNGVLFAVPLWAAIIGALLWL